MSNMTNMVTSLKHGVRQFIKEHVEYNPNGIVTKKELYAKYQEYCNTYNHIPLTMGPFARALNKLSELRAWEGFELRINDPPQGLLPSTTRRTIDGVRTWCWAGIKLKEIDAE